MLLKIGVKKGLRNKEHIEKDYYQDLILYQIYKRSNAFVFKGGTALYKFYGLKRFSADIDFTLLEKIDIERLFNKIAVSVKADIDSKIMKDSVLFKLKFKGILTKRNMIRVDISTKNKVLKGFDLKAYVPEYPDVNPFYLKVLKPEEMIAEKVHSLLARENARDLYDLFFLLRFSKFDKKLVEEKLEIFNMNFSPRKLKKRIENLKVVWDDELKPFVLEELPNFEMVKRFVLERI